MVAMLGFFLAACPGNHCATCRLRNLSAAGGLQFLEQILMSFKSEFWARPIHHYHRPHIQNRRPLDETIVPERPPGIDEIDDPVRQSQERCHLNASIDR